MHQILMKIQHIYWNYFCKFLKKWVYPQILTNIDAVYIAVKKINDGKQSHNLDSMHNLQSKYGVKNTVNKKNMPENERSFAQLEWIVENERAVKDIKIFIVNHNMAISIFNFV